MKWVIRARPVIDRIACPWLIARFLDKEAKFLFVAPDRVQAVAKGDRGNSVQRPRCRVEPRR